MGFADPACNVILNVVNLVVLVKTTINSPRPYIIIGEYLCTYSRKKFTFRLRRTVEKRSVPFPLYSQPFLGTLFVRSENGHEYGKSTVAKRKRNGLN